MISTSVFVKYIFVFISTHKKKITCQMYIFFLIISLKPFICSLPFSFFLKNNYLKKYGKTNYFGSKHWICVLLFVINKMDSDIDQWIYNTKFTFFSIIFCFLKSIWNILSVNLKNSFYHSNIFYN
jgi:hypothetical protein